MQKENHLDNWKVIAAASMLGCAGLIMIYFVPLLVGAVDEQLNLTNPQKGLFGASDLIGYGLASLSSFFWIRKVNWKWMAVFGIIIMLLGNLLSIQIVNFNWLVAIRIFTGLGQGITVGLAMTVIGDSSKTDRNLAIYLVLTLIVGMIGLNLLTDLIANYGTPPIYLTQVLLSILTLPFVLWAIPKKGLDFESKIGSGKLSKPVLMSLGAFFLLYIAYGGLWILVERFGTLAGHSPEFIGSSLSNSLIGGFLGLLIPIFIGDKIGRLIPIIVGFLGLSAFALLLFEGSSTSYQMAVFFGLFGVNLAVPYLTGIVVDLDNSGKGVAMIPAMYSIGVFVGPIVLSYFLTVEKSPMAGFVACGLFVTCMLIYIGLVKVTKNLAKTKAYT